MGLECYRIGDLVLDTGTQEVKRGDQVVPMPRLSFRLLLALARHAPNVVSADQLEKEVWDGLVVDRGTVNKRVLLLRNALAEGQGGEPYVTVIRGSGYRLIVPVARVDSATDETNLESAGRHGQASLKSRVTRNFVYWLLVTAVILVSYHGIQTYLVDDETNEAAGTATTGVQAPSMPISQDSIAVLPFVDLSDGQAHQFIGDGIAEEVINLLARMDGLEVAARTSSFAFHGTPLTALEIASRLRVGKILEGSIRHSDDRIRVTAQLIDVQTGFHIWSQNYDRAFNEVFEVQDDIAGNITQLLKLAMDEGSALKSRRATTGNFEAFELYLKGREIFNNRIELRAAGLHEALEYFSRAVALDPGFARAHASIALTSWVITTYDQGLDKEIWFRRTEASANYALELDAGSTDALAALASVYASRGDVNRALTLFERAHAFGANESYLAHWDAMLRMRLGYFEELVEPLTQLYRLDPLNEHIGWSLAAVLNFSGHPSRAIDILEGLEHFTFRQYALGMCALNDRDYQRARELLPGVRMRSGVMPANYAELLVDALQDPSRMVHVVSTILSAAEQGDLDRLVAFELLLMLGSPAAFDLPIDPNRDVDRKQVLAQVWNNWGIALRQDWRFKEWVTQLGYGDVWKDHGWPDRCKPIGADSFECI